MSALEPRTTTTSLVHPVTGELVELDATTDILAEQLTQLRRFELDHLAVFKRAVAEELLARMDREAKWTWRSNGFEVTGDGPGRLDYDAEALYGDLGELVADGVISLQAAEEAVEQVTEFKARKRGIQALKKLGGVVAEVISRHEVEPTRPRAVRVKELPR